MFHSLAALTDLEIIKIKNYEGKALGDDGNVYASLFTQPADHSLLKLLNKSKGMEWLMTITVRYFYEILGIKILFRALIRVGGPRRFLVLF